MKYATVVLLALFAGCGSPTDWKEVEINVTLTDGGNDDATVIDALRGNCDANPEDFTDSFLVVGVRPVLTVQSGVQVNDLYAVLDSVEFSFTPANDSVALESIDDQGDIVVVSIEPTPIEDFIARPSSRTNFRVNTLSSTSIPFITIERKSAWYAETLKRYIAKADGLAATPSFPTIEYNYLATFRFLEDVNSTEDDPTSFREVKHRGSVIIGNYDNCN